MEWIRRYVKHKDLIQRKITSIKEEGNTLVVEYKDKTVRYVFQPTLTDLNAGKDEKEYICIVTLNNRNNINFLYNKWKEAAANTRLSLIFFNPYSVAEQKWVIHPHVHNKSADPSSLKKGLLAMAENVDEIKALPKEA